MMDWGVNIGTLVELALLVGAAGIAYNKISVLERNYDKLENSLRRDIDRLEKEVIDYRDLKSDLAVVKAQLQAIHGTLERFIEDSDA